MKVSQFPPFEVELYLDKTLPSIKCKKTQSFLLYLLFILYFSLPSFQIPLLEYSHFSITSLMQQRAIEKKLNFYPQQSWVSIDEVNPNLLKAIISMEDGSFFIHKGIDWKELNTALKINKRRGRSVRGGSTLTMQLAKNLYLTTEKSIFRKAKEFLIAFRMEKEISKRAILKNYINAVEWGDGIFGIEKASEIYFNKQPANLNINECARLAAVIPSPLVHSPAKNTPYVIRRSSIILGRLNDIILFPGKK
ncbi:MAG TPA: monofunctional biosynthetic peptidoglycan transglycosylase [Ignavibacteriaceae bacterium]|nr:monofunctional biosynthetic peptidoglycan transglycosylase [Ignavibacteriaceae bacterium]